jgi:trimethylamine:corrinoid methyltransferase-like protein
VTKNGFRFKILSEADADTLFEKCLALLSEKGVKVQHPKALKILGEAGARVDSKGGQVSFPIELIEECLRRVPATCSLAARNGRSDLILPHPQGLFYTSTTTGGRRYVDPETLTHRDATLADVVEFGQLSEALDEIEVTAFQSPTDVPPETADVHALRALLENTSKHICVQPYSLGSLEYLFELATVVAEGSDTLKQKPIIDMIVCSVSPLTFKPMDVEAILWSCRRGVPIMACSLPSAGGTSPITIAGTVLIASVEILAMLVMSQIIESGIPFVACPIIFSLDMATGGVLETSAEAILGAVAVTEFVKDRFHVPTSTLGFGSDSHIPDEQCMIEDCLLAETTALGRSNDILWEAGSLQSIAAFSPVQLIIDNTITSLLKRILSGVTVDEETLAWEDLLDIAPGASFIDRDHTLRHCRDPLRPELFDRRSLEMWKAGGSKSLYSRALDKYREIKKALKPLALPDSLKKEMDHIVKRADQNLAKSVSTPARP